MRPSASYPAGQKKTSHGVRGGWRGVCDVRLLTTYAIAVLPAPGGPQSSWTLLGRSPAEERWLSRVQEPVEIVSDWEVVEVVRACEAEMECRRSVLGGGI